MIRVGVFRMWDDVVGHQTAINKFLEEWTKQGYDLDRVLQTQSSQDHHTYTTITVWMRKKG